MRLSVSLVAVKKITTSSSPASFDEEKINRLAEQILKAEGIISPLIVRRTSLESYELVEGDFEYFAAVKAREIDPRKGETISAYIIEPENDDVSDAIAEQIELLKQSADNLLNNDVIASPIHIQEEVHKPNEMTEILKSALSKINAHDSKLNTLGISLQKLVETTEKITLQKTLSIDESNLEAMIQKVMEKYISDLDVIIQKALEKYISEVKPLKTSTASPKKLQYDQEKEKLFIDGLNNFDVSLLTEKLSQAKYTTAETIAKTICDYRPYKSIEDFMSRQDFSKTMSNKLLKVW